MWLLVSANLLSPPKDPSVSAGVNSDLMADCYLECKESGSELITKLALCSIEPFDLTFSLLSPHRGL